jgi:hypothetical protein
MDPFSTAAGIIAVIQIADRIVSLCKRYLEAANDAPSDLRLLLVETSTMKTVLESLSFLCSCDHQPSSLDCLLGNDGPIAACHETLTRIHHLFPSHDVDARLPTPKRRREAIMAALAWPLKESKAKKLLSELVQHKTTISLALTSDLRQVSCTQYRQVKDGKMNR